MARELPTGSSQPTPEAMAGQRIVGLHLVNRSGREISVRILWEWTGHRVSSQHAGTNGNSWSGLLDSQGNCLWLVPCCGLGSYLGFNSVGTSGSVESTWAGWSQLWADKKVGSYPCLRSSVGGFLLLGTPIPTVQC